MLEVPVKGGRLKCLPLTPPLMSLLSRLPRLGPYVFTNPATLQPYTRAGVKASWQRACRRARIKDFRFHDLRHQAATLLYELGYDEGMIKRIGGWRSTAAMERYRHVREPLVVEALQALGNTLMPYLTADASGLFDKFCNMTYNCDARSNLMDRLANNVIHVALLIKQSTSADAAKS